MFLKICYYEFCKTCKKNMRSSHTNYFVMEGWPLPDLSQTSRSGHCQTWARSDNRLPWNFSTRVILENIGNLGRIEVQWQSFLADWKFFVIKIIKIKKLYEIFSIGYSKVWYNLSGLGIVLCQYHANPQPGTNCPVQALLLVYNWPGTVTFVNTGMNLTFPLGFNKKKIFV